MTRPVAAALLHQDRVAAPDACRVASIRRMAGLAVAAVVAGAAAFSWTAWAWLALLAPVGATGL